ncbi:ImpA family type VI secretion system protein [Roseateles amylovorans]|uniref:Type VI secretion system ImpA family N-terminal domain-containing protein n=1 Tax=Roseateles amylovorans TaxID=2978473 RepID=A0ABY6AWL2_9BURK|nr:type VI secretion system ImpA family N-terminal domain-containing protein [Roseateles amylovorans]UXH76159.1 type VI secretion system ImpA family N-terminal domain-containing protein [Roseateles amylovorans]
MFDQPSNPTAATFAPPLGAPSPEDWVEWIRPLDADAPGGPNLEYEPAFAALMDALRGRPETQFAPAQPPDWPLTRQLATDLLPRTRDLRIAVAWARASVACDGLSVLPAALALLAELLDQAWDGLHPLPDAEDEEAFARQGQLVDLDTVRGLLGDLRHAPLHRDRRLPALRLRDVQVALDRLPLREGDERFDTEQLQRFFGDEPALCVALRSQVEAASGALGQLRQAWTRRFGADAGVRLKEIGLAIGDLQGLLPDVDRSVTDGAPSADDGQVVTSPDGSMEDSDLTGHAGSPGDLGAGASHHAGPRSIRTRSDALAGLRQIREFLERTEPTNPAQLMLRRAEQLIDKDFFALVREIAPGGIADAARILGLQEDALDASA